MDAEVVRRDEPGSESDLSELLGTDPLPLRDEAGALLPGSLLLLALHARERGLDRGHPGWSALAREPGIDAAAIDRIQAFADRLLSREGSASVTFCLGVSCSLNGANELRDLIVAALERCGAAPPRDEVYCLSQCDRGPSIMQGSEIYCGTMNDVIEDRRDWRGDAGPVSISDTSRPVRD